jgi:hypothetical protein
LVGDRVVKRKNLVLDERCVKNVNSGRPGQRISMAETLICKGCKAPKKIAECHNVGEMIERSGYQVVMESDTNLLWLCPTCVEALGPHVQAIVDMMGSDNLYWPHMVALLKSRPDRKENL